MIAESLTHNPVIPCQALAVIPPGPWHDLPKCLTLTLDDISIEMAEVPPSVSQWTKCGQRSFFVIPGFSVPMENKDIT